MPSLRTLLGHIEFICMHYLHNFMSYTNMLTQICFTKDSGQYLNVVKQKVYWKRKRKQLRIIAGVSPIVP